MRKYLLGTGLLGAITSGYSLLRGSDERRFTWRVALAWLGWGITFALALGEVRDIRTASRGGLVADDSPIAGKEYKYAADVSKADAKKAHPKKRK